MRNIGAAAVILCSICASLSAQANWQYTQWNMTRAQVVAAAQGDAHAVTGTRDQQIRGHDLGAQGSYAAEGVQFKSEFYFNKAGRLKYVRLLPRPEACGTLQQKLLGVYGRPVKKFDVVDSTVIIWRDTAKRNQVQFTFGAEFGCLILYEPLKRSGAGGL